MAIKALLLLLLHVYHLRLVRKALEQLLEENRKVIGESLGLLEEKEEDESLFSRNLSIIQQLTITTIEQLDEQLKVKE